MKKVTVRFPEETARALADLSKEFNKPQAEIVRAALLNRLTNYLGGVKYIDQQQADEIQKQLYELTTEISKLHSEIRRIGVNYNQEIRLKQIANKYKNEHGYPSIRKQQQEEEEAMKECSVLKPGEMSELLQQYEDTTIRIGEILKCLIHE